MDHTKIDSTVSRSKKLVMRLKTINATETLQSRGSFISDFYDLSSTRIFLSTKHTGRSLLNFKTTKIDWPLKLGDETFS